MYKRMLIGHKLVHSVTKYFITYAAQYNIISTRQVICRDAGASMLGGCPPTSEQADMTLIFYLARQISKGIKKSSIKGFNISN